MKRPALIAAVALGLGSWVTIGALNGKPMFFPSTHSVCSQDPDPSSGNARPQTQVAHAPAGTKATPLVIGESFVFDSKILGEIRRINVYLPPTYSADPTARLPVLYMPDGGLAEDFLHIAGLVQV